MGRATHLKTIQHPSHRHTLYLFQQPSPTRCAACGYPVSRGALTYACQRCSYTLHATCSTLPSELPHPFHPPHDLHLLFTPTYHEGSFSCDACGLQGTAFSYHCRDCDVDLHALCALLPASFIHPSHFHPLSLSFCSSYEEKCYTCDVCGKLGAEGRWLYRCSVGCEFDAHLECIVLAAPSHGVRFQQAQRRSQLQQQQREGGVLTPRKNEVPPQSWNAAAQGGVHGRGRPVMGYNQVQQPLRPMAQSYGNSSMDMQGATFNMELSSPAFNIDISDNYVVATEEDFNYTGGGDNICYLEDSGGGGDSFDLFI